MNHWLDGIIELIDAKTSDLRELAEMVGGDPQNFYLGTGLDGVDICGQDLRGMQFTSLSSATVKYDASTLLDAKHSTELNKNPNATFVIYNGLLGTEPTTDIRAEAGKRIRDSLNERGVINQAVNLLAVLLEDSQVGILMLENYPRGRGTTIDEALYLMTRAITERKGERLNLEEDRLNLAVAQTIDAMLRSAYIFVRPNLLVAMARRLGKFPVVREVLIRAVRRSHAHRVVGEKDELAEHLGVSRDALGL